MVPVRRERLPSARDHLAQAAAVASLGDEAFLQRSYDVNRSGLAAVCDALDEMGVEYVPSLANFVMMRVGDGAAVNQSLLRQGVIVRPMAMYGLPEWLRVTVGLPEENLRMLDALRTALAQTR